MGDRPVLDTSQSPVLRYLCGPLFLRDLLLVGLTLVALEGVLRCKFVDYDDPIYVYDNHHHMGVNLENLQYAFTSTAGANWHPLTWISFQLETTLDDPVPVTYHRTNLILHLANVWLLAEVLRRMTGAVWRSAIVAALFAVHPLHVESVAWVSERKDVLSTFFGLLALAAYLRYSHRPSVLRMGVVFLAMLASLMSKPMLVTLPCALLLLDYWPLGRLRAAVPPAVPSGRPPVGVWWAFVEKTPLFLLAVGWCFITMLTQKDAMPSTVVIPPSLRFANAAYSVVAYLVQTAYPVNLCIHYPYPRDGLLLHEVAGAGLFLIAVTGFLCWQLRTRPYLAVGWFWFLGTLVPVIGLVQVGAQARADRYTYVPHIGLFLMLVWGLSDLLSRRRVVGIVLTAAVLTICVVLTRFQVDVWATNLGFWTHAVAVRPDSVRSRDNLARALAIEGRYEEGLKQVEEAKTLEPRATVALLLTEGQLYERLERWDDAEKAYRERLDNFPDDEKAQKALRGVPLNRRAKEKEKEKKAKGK
jgi:protein O-mannosyl-transferase